jgi:hypothetical protein
MTFADATAVSPAGDGRFHGGIEPGWDILGNADGGYMMAIAARAATHALGRPDPVTATAHFLRPGTPGPVEVATEVVKEGRRFGTASATLERDGTPLLRLLGTFGSLESSAAFERVDGSPPDVPPFDDCVELEPTDTFPPPFMGKVVVRLHPEDAFAGGVPSGKALVRGWFALRDDEPVDTLALLVGVDAFPPTAFNAGLPFAWTPTIELTAHVRARPEPGPLRCIFSTRFITGGFLEVDGELWDSTGRLVAQSRQLALLPA